MSTTFMWDMPAGWSLNNVSFSRTASWRKTFEVVGRNGVKYGRRFIVGFDPFSDAWFWSSTRTTMDDGMSDGLGYQSPVACAIACELVMDGLGKYAVVKPREAHDDVA